MRFGKTLPITILFGLLFLMAITMIPITQARVKPANTELPAILTKEPPREETVWMTGSYDSPTQFLPWSTNLPPGSELMYESLFGYNSEKGKLIPCIGTNYSWSKTGDSITIDLNSKAKWSNGETIDADDVVYSYELAQAQARYTKDFSARFTNFTKVDKDTVRFDINTTAGYNHSRQVEIWIEYNIPIVPKDVWTEIVEEKDTMDLGTYQYDWFDSEDVPDKWKVISGPYAPVYRDASESTCAYQYREDWWGAGVLYQDIPNADKEPPKYIGGVRFATNTEQDLAFIKGNIDLYAGYYHHIWDIWEGAKEGSVKSYISCWYGHEEPYQLAASTLITLAPNHLLKDSPLGVKEFREALSYAINYEPIPDAAASGYWTTSKPGYIDDNSALHKPYYNASVTEKYEKSLDVDKAIAILKNITGMTGNEDDGWKYNDKKVGPYEAIVPTGWSDVVSYTEMVCADIKENLGIEIEATQVDYEKVFQPKIADNDFDFALFCVGNRISDPPQRFLDYMRGVHLWNKNATNWQNKEFEALWQTLESANETVYKANLNRMQEILAQEVPEIPGFVNGYWYAYNGFLWDGWTNAKNNFQQICTTWTNDQFAIKTRLLLNLESTGRKLPSKGVIPWFGLELFILIGIISIAAVTVFRLKRKRE
ncbi:MAG: ABC transporter substrate-binding protein [Promethearchaeota archaeon]